MKRYRTLSALFVCIMIAAGILIGVPVQRAEARQQGDDTAQLEQRQAQSDQVHAPALRRATSDNDTQTFDTSNGTVVNDFIDTSENDAAPVNVIDSPDDLRINLLQHPNAVDKERMSFSWKNHANYSQTQYLISIYLRVASVNAVYSTGWISSADHQSVELPNVDTALQDNQLYYWQVSVGYSDGTVRSSARSSFVTAIGDQFVSTDVIWTQQSSISNLIRTKITQQPEVEKAVLSVTALDTEAARRHVFNVFVNGDEIGVGPSRRAGNDVYYNTYDVTAFLNKPTNIIGIFSYSQAEQSGVLMQLTYFYQNGSQDVVYNSGRDRESTQIKKMDSAIYGNPDASIGTGYYTELAQNVDVTQFPYRWQVPSDFDESPWVVPQASAWPQYELIPSPVENVVRNRVRPSSVTRNQDGSYTIAFDKEIIGDIELNATAAVATDIRITEGEEIEKGKAKYEMRTGNKYDETWRFQGENVTFTGFSLRAFRYVTIYGYPGILTLDHINGIETHIPTDNASNTFLSSNSLLNEIVDLTKYSYRETTLDTISDSVTRERRPYEGDNLIYQDLSYVVGGDSLSARNTWTYLLANPSQYTEYRLMTVIGVYRDYVHTHDRMYMKTHYEQLKQMLNTVSYDKSVGLVTNTGNTIDLVDWPRTELTGYDVNGTTYKTVVNAVAVEAYRSFGQLAQAMDDSDTAAYYLNISKDLKQSMISKLYDADSATWWDGLKSSGQLVRHHSAQNDYMALAFGIYADQKMANKVASRISRDNRQIAGSIYMSYFMYRGLVRAGHADVAVKLLGKTDSNDKRTLNSVLHSLGATITPEAWDVDSKPNMTFSHAWGTGGGIGLIASVADFQPLDSGRGQYALILRPDALPNSSIAGTLSEGAFRVEISAENTETYQMHIELPFDIHVVVRIPTASDASEVTLDGEPVSLTQDQGMPALTIDGGIHDIAVTLSQETHNPTDSLGEAKGDSLAVRRDRVFFFKNSIAGGEADRTIVYGRSGDSVLVGDWDGDGKDTLAVRRGNVYYFKNSVEGGEADKVIAYGRPGDTVLVGDWNGDGTDSLAVRRGNVYYFKNAIEGGEADTILAYGRGDDDVLVGDWDGNGSDTLCVRRGVAFFFKNVIEGGEADKVIAYGHASDTVLVGDWNGDSKDTLTVRRGNVYYFKNSIAGGDADAVIVYGKVSDEVLVGNWDGK